MENERRILVKKGERVRLVLEEGPIVDISHISSATPFVLEQRSLDARGDARERLKALYPSVLFPHVRARLEQHSYEVLKGGEQESAVLTLMETENALKSWIEEAKKSGISNQDISKDTSALLKQVMIGSPQMGKINPMIKGIGTEIEGLVADIWGVKRKTPTAINLPK